MASEGNTFRHSVSVLRTGIYARFMAAEFISMIGAWMQTQAQQFLVEEQAKTSLQQAMISFALMIVIPLFGPWGGTLADRADRRRILTVVIAIQAVLAATVGWLVQAGWIQLWQLTIVAIVLGMTHAFEGPAYSALLPSLVPREKLSAAIALDRSVFHAARIIGPALAGVLVAQRGTASAFYANALSFLPPLIILATLPPRPRGSEEEEHARRTGFAEGWRYAQGDAPTFRMIMLMAASALFCSPFVMVLLTFYARRTLGLDAAAVGWLMSLTGIGALVASFGLLAIPARKRPRYLRLGAACTVVSMLGLAVAERFAVAAIAFSCLTLGLNFIYGIGNQLIQERAPDALRGRISAVASLSFVAVIPFSGIFAALLDGSIGMRWALAVCALGYAIVAGIQLTRRWPREDLMGEAPSRSTL
jgi:MFS family permease